MPYISTKLRKELIIDKIITIHYLEYDSEFRSVSEVHDFWEFVCVDTGVVEIVTDEETFFLKNDMAVFHKPMLGHAVNSANKKAPSLLIFSFESRSPIMRLFENKIIHITPEDKKILSQILLEAENAFSTPVNVHTIEKVERSSSADFGAEQIIQNLMEIFLIRIVRRNNIAVDYQENIQRQNSLKYYISNDVKHHPSLDKIVEYLKIHLSDSLLVSKIATDNLVGRSQLQEMFHKEFGCGVIHYFSQLKMNKAKELIREGKFSIQQISLSLGYQSISYFSRQFKNFVGASPTEYSNSIKQISERKE